MAERRERNKVEVGMVFKDLDGRYTGRAADRRLTVIENLGSYVTCRTTIGGRESKKTTLLRSRLADPGRFFILKG